VTLVSRTIADLTAQATSIDAAHMTDFLKASATIMYPFASASLKVTVSCISVDSAGKATVKWSETLNGTKQATGAVATLPTTSGGAAIWKSTQLLWSDVQYTYTPVIGYVVTGPLTLKDKMYMSPRISAPTYASVACT
jgi:Flp pilus assembly protein TadG